MQVIQFIQRDTTTTIEQLRPKWLRDLDANGNRKNGVLTYGIIFGQFIAFAGNIPVNQITPDLIRDYKRDQMSRVGAGTARHRLTVVRSFCAWSLVEGYLPYNPALLVAHPKVVPPDPDPLSREEIRQLLAIVDDEPRLRRDVWLRNRRAVCLMLYAGLRIAEVAALRWRDIDLERLTIRVRSEGAKFGKPRMIPICDELLVELRAAVERRPDWAVVDQGDGKNRGKPLNVKSLAHIFERWVAARGMRIHAHQLRKTFATELYHEGEDLFTIQRLLGHADPKTTIFDTLALLRKKSAGLLRN